MNKLIEKQLSMVQYADLSQHDELKHEFNIKKRVDIKLELDAYYLIHLKDTLMDPNLNELIRVNWNGNRMPTLADLTVEVCKVMGKMVKVNAIGYDPETKQDVMSCKWTGWLPIDEIKIVEKL